MVKSLAQWFHDFLHRPVQVMWWCLGIVFLSLLFNGSLLQLWSLSRDRVRLEESISEIQSRSNSLEFRIQEAQQPEFIERQARDQFDLVKAGDLIFVFSDK